MPSPFGKADRGNASELSVATTAFIASSQLGYVGADRTASSFGTGYGGASGSATAPDALTPVLAASPPGPKEQSQFQLSLPYRTETESSVVSDWKQLYWREGGKGIGFARGLRGLDLRYANAQTPGVCVLKGTDDVPKVPGITKPDSFPPMAHKMKNIDAITKQLLQMGVELHEPHDHRKHVPAPERSSNVDEARSASNPNFRSPSMVSRTDAGTTSEANIDRSMNLPAKVARNRYQHYVVAKPKKGHRFVNPEGQ